MARNNFMRVWTDLCKRKCSYAAGNNFMQVWTDLCNRKCSHAAGNNFMRVWTDLCDRKWSCAAGTKFMTVGMNSILNFPPKFELECAEPIYVVMTHHTAKANLEKGSCWPPEAIPYGVPHTRGLVLTRATFPTPWTQPQIPLGPSPPPTIRLLKKD